MDKIPNVTVDLCEDCASCKYYRDGECMVAWIAKTLCDNRDD